MSRAAVADVEIGLDEQIVAVLTGHATSDQAADVLKDAEAALVTLTRHADAADVASLDPLATSVQARARRQEAADLHFEADRLEASVSALSARLAELKDDERRARDAAAKAAVVEQRDALANEIAERYPLIVGELTSIVKRIAECDALCQRVGVQSAESVGRGIPASFYQNGGPVTRLADARLPMPASSRCAWESSIDGMNYFGLHASDDARL